MLFIALVLNILACENTNAKLKNKNEIKEIIGKKVTNYGKKVKFNVKKTQKLFIYSK